MNASTAGRPRARVVPEVPSVQLGGVWGFFKELAARFWRLSWLVQVGIVWLAGRLFTAVFVTAVARFQGPSPWTSAKPDYLSYVDGWDAGFFRTIYESWYPAVLPRLADGSVDINPWAFLPGYPLLVRGVSAVTGLGWSVAAPLVSTLACLGLLLVCHRLFVLFASPRTATIAVTAISFGTAAPVLQFNYAESVGLALVAIFLYLLVKGRYLTAIPVALLAGLTRPLAAPIAVTCAVVAVMTLVAQRRSQVLLPKSSWWSLIALCLVTAAAIGLWPAYAQWYTGEPGAYFLTEAAWHGGAAQTPLRLYLASFVKYFGRWLGLPLAGVLLAAIAVWMFSEPMRRVGGVLWAWTGSVFGYLTMVVPVNSSYLRLLMSGLPLYLALIFVSRSKAYRVAVIVALAASQVVWLAWFWLWTVGGDEPPP